MQPRCSIACCFGSIGRDALACLQVERRLRALKSAKQVNIHELDWAGPCESFNGRLHDECLNVTELTSLDHARAILTAWQDEKLPRQVRAPRSNTAVGPQFICRAG